MVDRKDPEGDRMIPAKVLFLGTARDCGRRIGASIKIAEKIGAMFEDCKFILYENDSKDNTRKILKQWAKRRPADVHFRYSTGDEKKVSWVNFQNGKPFRPEQISHARNIILEKAMSPEFDSYDYVLVMDFDFVLEPDYGAIRACFDREDWDGVFANGIAPDGRYWDWFALRDVQFPLGTETMGDAWYALKRPYHFLTPEDSWYPVYSAFGGFGIYRREALAGCRYSAVITPEIGALNASLGARGTALHQGIGPEPSLCEHVGLHAVMRSFGRHRLFINPAMIFRYGGGPVERPPLSARLRHTWNCFCGWVERSF